MPSNYITPRDMVNESHSLRQRLAGTIRSFITRLDDSAISSQSRFRPQYEHERELLTQTYAILATPRESTPEERSLNRSIFG